jgi:hypothetical protein
LNKEIIYLSSRLISSMLLHYDVETVTQVVFQHPQMSAFIQAVSQYPDPFIRSTILGMMETLCTPQTYIQKDRQTEEGSKAANTAAKNLLAAKEEQVGKYLDFVKLAARAQAAKKLVEIAKTSRK